MKNQEICHTSQSLKLSPASRHSKGQRAAFFRRERTSSSGHLHSLSRLETLKNDPTMQSLTYDQVKNIDKSSTTINFRQLQKKMNLDQPSFEAHKPKESSPASKSVTNSASKTRWQKSRRLRSQDRQILVEHYKSKPESTAQHKSAGSLDSVWHYTLSNLTNLKHRPNEFSTRNASSSPKAEGNSVLRICNTEESQDFRMSVELQTKKSNEVGALFTRRAMNSEGSYTVLIKKVEYFNKSLTDFYKTVSYLQRAYDKAKFQQDHLYNFVSAFIQEVGEVEKDLKRTNIPILNACLINIDTKLGELVEEKEFLVEQTQYIREQIRSVGVSEGNKSVLSARKRTVELVNTHVDNPVSTHRSSLLKVLPEESSIPSIQKGSRLLTGWSEDSVTLASLKGPRLVKRIDSRTIVMKTEGSEEETIRPKTPIKLKKERCMSSKGRVLRAKTPISIVLQTSRAKDFASGVREVQALGYDTKTMGKKSFSQGNLHSTQRPSVVLNSDNSEMVSVNRKELEKNVNIQQNMLVDSSSSRNNVRDEPKDGLKSATELYELYQVAVEKLEEKVKKILKEMKLFQKGVTDVQTKQSTRLVTLQIKYFFETMLNEFHTSTIDLSSRHAEFLQDVEYNLFFLQDVNNSNVLKLTSLRNILNDSVRKVSSINKFMNKYTCLDLTDKALRRRFADVFEGLKTDLNSDKKTLLFLSEQFNRTTAICPLNSETGSLNETLSPLVNKSKTLLRALYIVDKLPQTEEEFVEKSIKANTICKSAHEVITSIREFSNNKDNLSAQKFEEGERTLRDLENVKIKVTAVLNELGAMNKIEVFRPMLNKPLILISKLHREIINDEKELKRLLMMIREGLILEYSQLTEKCKVIQQQVIGYVLTVTNSSRNFSISDWEESYRTVRGYKDALNSALGRIMRYTVSKYPSSIKLLPEPVDQKQGLVSCQLKIECLIKVINTKKMFAEQEILKFFEGVKSYNIKEKLEGLRNIIQEEVVKNEKLIGLLDNDSEIIKKMVVETIGALLQLKFILKKSFELQDKTAKMYKDFNRKDIENASCLINAIKVGNVHRTKASFGDIKGRRGSRNRGNDGESQREAMKDKQISVMTIMLPEDMDLDNQYSDYLEAFIQELRSCFESFKDVCKDPYIQEYKVCEDALKCIQKVLEEELVLLSNAKAIIMKVQASYKTYTESIKPLASLQKCLEILNKPDDKLKDVIGVQNIFSADLKEINKYQGMELLQGGLDLQVQKCRQIQQTFLSSSEVLKGIYFLGSIFNERDLQIRLGSHLRTHESRLDEYAQIITERFSKVLEHYNRSDVCFEGSIASLLNNTEVFISDVCRLFRVTHFKYLGFTKILSDGLYPFNGDFVTYIEKATLYISGLSQEFQGILERIYEIGGNSTWLTRLLEKFDRDVLSKDVIVFEKLLEQTRSTEMHTLYFENDFISREVVQNQKYRNIEVSDPSQCDSKAEEYGAVYKTVCDLYNCEEILCRQEFKIIFSSRLKKFKAMSQLFLLFAMIYSMGRNLHNRLTLILSTKNVIQIVNHATELVSVLSDIIERLKSASEEAKLLEKESQISFIVNLGKIIKEDVLVFYCSCKAWTEALVSNLYNLANCYTECQAKFQKQHFFLHEDKIIYLKEFTNKKFEIFQTELPSIMSDYAATKLRMDEFIVSLKEHIKISKAEFTHGLKAIEYLNTEFFQVNFFQVSNARTSYGDKVIPRIDQVIEKIQNEKYVVENVRSYLREMVDIFAHCMKSIKALDGYSVFKEFLLRDWDLVGQYCQQKKFKCWKALLMFAMNELVSNSNLSHVRGKELHMIIEEKLKFELDGKQKQLIDVLCYSAKNNV